MSQRFKGIRKRNTRKERDKTETKRQRAVGGATPLKKESLLVENGNCLAKWGDGDETGSGSAALAGWD